MAFKLTKEEIEAHEKLCAALSDDSEKLQNAISDYNEEMEAAGVKLQAAVDEYNKALEAARDHRDGVVSSIDDELADKSEKWHEGEKGQAVVAWKETWENLELEEVNLELPEPLSFDDIVQSDPATELGELQYQPDMG